MRPGKPSRTAAVVAGVRALYAELPTPYGSLNDASARQLVPGLYRVPATIARRFPKLAPVLHHGLGHATFGLTHHVALRTKAIDEALVAAVRAGCRQVVLLGAGLDNRARRLGLGGGVRFFEVDYPSMLHTRGETMAGLCKADDDPSRSPTTAVAVDFETMSLSDALQGAKFLSTEPSFWVWEGVTMYLTPSAFRSTLQTIAQVSAAGSRLSMTYARPRVSGLRDLFIAPAGWMLAAMGEPIPNLMDTVDCHRALAACGLSVVTDEGATDWARRHWPHATAMTFEWERMVVARVEPR